MMQLPARTAAKSLHNPFRDQAEAQRPRDSPSMEAETDLETSPTSLERSPSPAAAQSRTPTPEPATATPPHASSTPQPTYEPPPGPPPPPRITPAPAPVPVPALDETIAEELPPAYTPTADVRQGETSIEFGPRRPFAQTTGRAYAPRTQRPSWQPTFGGSARSSARTGSNWTGYPGTAPVRRPPVGAPLLRVDPPPQHPMLPGRGAGVPPSHSAPAAQPLSDFARDFYTALPAGENINGNGLLGGSSAQYDGSASNSHGSRPTTPGGSNSHAETPDDGRPTNKPVPGHPLLNSGKVLVYPAGYECSKCHNTGYKHYDPSNPCTKCWTKYAKAFAGPLTYAPWAPAAAGIPAPDSGSGASHNLQRPLPNLPSSPTSTSSGHRYSHSLTDLAVPPAHPDVSRSASTSRPSRNPNPAYAPPPIPPHPTSPGSVWPPPAWTVPSPTSGVRIAAARPPPGATVVRPGDPRIGGRLCWRCGGSGVTSFLIFDEQTCAVCAGLGRTF